MAEEKEDKAIIAIQVVLNLLHQPLPRLWTSGMVSKDAWYIWEDKMNIRLLGQCVLQLFGLMYAIVKNNSQDIEASISEIEYALPFAGEWYVANGGVTKEVSHSWDILPQRFAYDFFVADENGTRFQGDKKNLSSYYCYGADILAPADGVVVAVKNHFPDSRIMDDEQTDPATPDIGGNRIILRHSPEEYSAICHLLPGSITVSKDQKVNKGDVIAKCGNSGNTTEPHIHFQIQNSVGFYTCSGLQIRFSNIMTKPHPNYEKMDTRPQPAGASIVDGFLHRGLLVKNR